MDEPKKKEGGVDKKIIIIIVVIFVVLLVIVLGFALTYVLWFYDGKDPEKAPAKPKTENPMSYISSYLKVVGGETYSKIRDRKEFVTKIAGMINKELESGNQKVEIEDDELKRQIEEETRKAELKAAKKKEEITEKILNEIEPEDDEFEN